MNSEEFNKKLEEAKNLKELQKKNITDKYMRGLYNGMELILSVFESREPRYADAEPKPEDKAKLKIVRNGHNQIVAMVGNTIIKNVTNIRIEDITAETIDGVSRVGVEAEIMVINPEINI